MHRLHRRARYHRSRGGSKAREFATCDWNAAVDRGGTLRSRRLARRLDHGGGIALVASIARVLVSRRVRLRCAAARVAPPTSPRRRARWSAPIRASTSRPRTAPCSSRRRPIARCIPRRSRRCRRRSRCCASSAPTTASRRASPASGPLRDGVLAGRSRRRGLGRSLPRRRERAARAARAARPRAATRRGRRRGARSLPVQLGDARAPRRDSSGRSRVAFRRRRGRPCAPRSAARGDAPAKVPRARLRQRAARRRRARRRCSSRTSRSRWCRS